jgi:hypothetical protein
MRCSGPCSPGEKPRKYGRRAGLVADRKWLKKTIAAIIAPYKAELAALKARAAEPAPPRIVNFVNPRRRRQSAHSPRPAREKARLQPCLDLSGRPRYFEFFATVVNIVRARVGAGSFSG